MHILFVEPFFTGSHKSWLRQLQLRSEHQIEVLSLSGRHWKWRMQGGAISLAKRFMASDSQPDAIVVSDMLDLATFQALTKQRTAHIRFAVYFHENQLSYPWSPNNRKKGVQQHLSLINYTSALAADKLYFNSRYHLDNFTSCLATWLKAFPDHQEIENVEVIQKKSKVLRLALDLQRFAKYRCPKNHKPLLLWNHRWEYDKNPKQFFRLLYQLMERNIDFEVVVLGKNIDHIPRDFQQAALRLGERLLFMGFAASADDYATWLWRATHVPVTSNQDFFGMSAIEAIACEVMPLLPHRLAFPEHLPGCPEVYYHSDEQLFSRFVEQLDIRCQDTYAKMVERYDWGTNIHLYDQELAVLVKPD